MLDIGCHIGATSLQIASHYDPAKVLGIDIDPQLIKAAIANLHKKVNQEECKKQISEGTEREESGM